MNQFIHGVADVGATAFAEKGVGVERQDVLRVGLERGPVLHDAFGHGTVQVMRSVHFHERPAAFFVGRAH